MISTVASAADALFWTGCDIVDLGVNTVFTAVARVEQMIKSAGCECIESA